MSQEQGRAITLVMPDDCPPEVRAMVGAVIVFMEPISPPPAMVVKFGEAEARARAQGQACLLLLARHVADVAEPGRERMIEGFAGLLRDLVGKNLMQDAAHAAFPEWAKRNGVNLD